MQRITVDGAVVEIGNVVWRVHRTYCSITRKRLTKHDLGSYWQFFSKEMFASQHAAVEVALADAQERARQAVRDLRRERRNIEKLQARLAGMDTSE